MPNTREKLIELLGGDMCKGCYCEECEHENNEKACIENLKAKMADHLIANGVTAQKWIPVTERLPDDEGLCLVAVVNDNERRYSKTAWYHGHGNWFLHQKVTHWMPLPEPPKGE